MRAHTGESYELHVIQALDSFQRFQGIARLDGETSGPDYILSWRGVQPETRRIVILRTESWSRYCRAVRRAIAIERTLPSSEPQTAQKSS